MDDLRQHAVPAYPEVLGVGALDHGGDGDDGVHHHQEGGDDGPVELVEEHQVWLTIPHQTLVRVQDHESAENKTAKKKIPTTSIWAVSTTIDTFFVSIKLVINTRTCVMQ